MSMNQAPEEQVWAREVEYWKCIEASDLVEYEALLHEAAVVWPNNQPKPLGKGEIMKFVTATCDAFQPGSGQVELIRRSVHVSGNIGIAYLQVHARATLKTGTPFEFKERVSHTWLRTNGAWKLTAGMSAPPVGDENTS
jgi:ketosteroid isomerase-like protein